MRRTLSVIGVLAGALLPASARADNVACYDWDCEEVATNTYLCTFDAGCSEIDGMLWRYNWNFGDGTGQHLTGSEVIQHQYGAEPAFPYVDLRVVTFTHPTFSVECQIVTHNTVGPPGPTSGNCTE